jgi:MFS family permease
VAGKLLRGSPLLFLFVTIFVDMIGYGFVIPLLPFYVQQQASGAALVGLLGSLYAAMQFVGGPFLGGLSDRVGRRPVLLLCLFGASFAYLLLGLADTLLLLVAAVVLAGGAAGTLATAQAFAASALALCNVAFGFFVLPESLPLARRTSTPILELNPVSQLAGVLGVGSIRALLLAVFLLNLSFAGLLTNFPLFSNARFGWDATANAFFFAFVGVCAVLTQGVLLGRLQPRFGEKRLLLSGLALMAVNLGLMALVPLGSLLYPVVGVLAVGTGLAIPSLTALISHRVSEREQGKVMGGQQAILSLTLILGPTISGLTFDRLGAPAPYWVGSLLAALALLAAAAALVPRGAPERYTSHTPREPGA